MKVLVFGYKGMLGRYVYSYLQSQGKFDVVGHSRGDGDVSHYGKYDIIHQLVNINKIGKDDYVINCIGIIKPQIEIVGMVNSIHVNSIFPHVLADACEEIGCNLIHVTTDCVFTGRDGRYDEESLHDCTDVYGKTKSLGEPDNCQVIRTSIIGEEVSTNRSLVEWVKSMAGQTVNGYTNHMWNGVTCLELSRIIDNLISLGIRWKGVRHLHSPNTLTKYDMVQTISDVYNLEITVKPSEGGTLCDRSLSTIYPEILVELGIPDIKTQIDEMKNFGDKLKKYS